MKQSTRGYFENLGNIGNIDGLIDTLIYSVENCIPFKNFCTADKEIYENLYGLASGLYQDGDYKQAIQIFGLLAITDAYDPRFIFSIAACNQCLKLYSRAVVAYLAASILDVKDPKPPFYAAECHIELGDIASAIEAYKFAMSIECHSKDRQEICKKAAKMYHALMQSNKKENNSGLKELLSVSDEILKKHASSS